MLAGRARGPSGVPTRYLHLLSSQTLLEGHRSRFKHQRSQVSFLLLSRIRREKRRELASFKREVSGLGLAVQGLLFNLGAQHQIKSFFSS